MNRSEIVDLILDVLEEVLKETNYFQGITVGFDEAMRDGIERVRMDKKVKYEK